MTVAFSKPPCSWGACLFLFAAFGLTLGCGGTSPRPNYEALGLVEISGIIRLDGIPLANAYIQFEDADGTYSYSNVDSLGRYRLRFDSNTYGTIPGKKVVRIRLGQAPSEESATDEEDPDSAVTPVSSAPVTVPACYNRKSVLTKLVTATESNVDFDLKSEGVPVPPGS